VIISNLKSVQILEFGTCTRSLTMHMTIVGLAIVGDQMSIESRVTLLHNLEFYAKTVPAFQDGSILVQFPQLQYQCYFHSGPLQQKMAQTSSSPMPYTLTAPEALPLIFSILYLSSLTISYPIKTTQPSLLENRLLDPPCSRPQRHNPEFNH